MRVSHFNHLQHSDRCITSSLPRSDVRLPFQLLAIQRKVRYQLSTSFQRASPISTACNMAAGALPALYIIPMRDSYFNSLKYDYRFVTGSLPRSNARLLFQMLAMRLQVRFWLSTLFQCASPISTACNTATGALPALYLVLTRLSHFNPLQYGDRYVTSSLPRSDAHLPFQLLAIWLQVRCQLSVSFRCTTPILTA